MARVMPQPKHSTPANSWLKHKDCPSSKKLAGKSSKISGTNK